MTFHSICWLFFLLFLFFHSSPKTIQSPLSHKLRLWFNLTPPHIHTRALSLYHHMCHTEHWRRRQPKTKEKNNNINNARTIQRRFAHDSCLFVYHTMLHRSLLSHPSISFALYVHKITAHNGWKSGCVLRFRLLNRFCLWKSITFSHFALITLKILHECIWPSYAHSCLLASVSAYFIQAI